MTTAHKPKADFDQRYQTHLKHLKLKGLQLKTIDAYARGTGAWATTSTTT